MSNQFSLLKTRRFLPFFLTQFLGAFNDNVFKQSLIILFTFNAAGMTSLSVNELTNLCGGLFILPFFLFSATAGQLADKYEKVLLIRIVKCCEFGIMALATLGFFYQQLWLLLTALFLMGLHSTVFGPIKYAILPQTLRPQELVGGNALIESGTSLAILFGSMLGGYLIAIKPQGIAWVALAVLIAAALGIVVSLLIPRTAFTTPALRIRWNLFRETWDNVQFIRGNRTVFLSILGISWFWFYGATFLAQIPPYTKNVLGGDEHVVTFLLMIFSVGIGVGSLLCEKLSDKKVELGLVPLGSIGLTLFAVDLYLATRHMTPHATSGIGAFLHQVVMHRVILDLFGIGTFGGFYIVPLYALIQGRSEPSHRARIIASNNILNALFMVVSALFAVTLLEKLHLTISQLFLVTAILSALVSIYIYTLAPEFFMRFLVWIFMSIFYRLKKRNIELIPEEGACVLVCNHVSFYDALLLAAAIRRPPRFVMDHRIFKIPVMSFIFRTARAIPIASQKEDPALLAKAYDDIAEALANGEVVCIFPEGRITDTGEIYPFKSGIQRIIERSKVPVIPMALRGMWGSVSSRKGGAAFTHLPRRFRSPVELVVGIPLPHDEVSPQVLQEQVMQLRGEWR